MVLGMVLAAKIQLDEMPFSKLNIIKTYIE